ncbi:MAG: hypothetical protein QN144_10175 [Armatimonadota bacterium]|nr:hypothetical protein [Armatimonadota bacterium]
MIVRARVAVEVGGDTRLSESFEQDARAYQILDNGQYDVDSAAWVAVGQAIKALRRFRSTLNVAPEVDTHLGDLRGDDEAEI